MIKFIHKRSSYLHGESMITTKRILSLLLILIMVLTLTSCGNNDTKEQNTQSNTPDENENSEIENISPKKPLEKVGMVTDSIGLEDNSINFDANRGLREFSEFNEVEIEVKVPTNQDRYEREIDNLANNGNDLIWMIGYAFSDLAKSSAIEYQDTKFAIIESVYNEKNMPYNLTAIMFKMQEPSYLAGYIGAYSTETNKLGFVGGIKGTVIDQYEYGFRAGVLDASKELKKEITVDVQYVESFSDKSKGSQIADSMYDEGVDIIYQAAGLSGVGVIESATSNKKFAIGSDQDQSILAPKNVIASSVKKADVVIKDVSLRIKNNEDIGAKNIEYGLKESGVGVVLSTGENSILNPGVYDKAIQIQKEIAEGRIIPPFNEKSFDKYQK